MAGISESTSDAAADVVGNNVSLTASINVGQSTDALEIDSTTSVSASAPGSGTPTGQVVFTVDNTPQAPIDLDAAGHATLSRSDLAVGGSSPRRARASPPASPSTASATAPAINDCTREGASTAVQSATVPPIE